MAHCPYCLSKISERDFVCPACGAEKGYIYFNRKSRGLAFTLMVGFLVPLTILLALPFYLQGAGTLFWMSASLALAIGIFTVYRLIVGPIWYR